MKSRVILCVLSVLLLADLSEARAEALLLHGGHVLQGEISQVEGVYHVKTGTGEIRIAVKRVERIFNTIGEIYQWKRSLIRVGSHSDHVELAKWCLKYELLDLAQGELVAAELAEPGTPMVDYLQRRITSKRKARDSNEPGRLFPSPTTKPVPLAPPLPSAHLPETPATLEKLDEVTASISPRSMAEFSRTIQPILLNNCATGGCHVGANCEKMRLNRHGLAGKAGRRVTQRNLQTVMNWITPDKPDYSPILTVPLRPHEGARAMIHGHREEYLSLVNWVMRVGREKKPVAKTSGWGDVVQPAVHTEPIRAKARSKKSILQETLKLIPPEGVNVQKKGKDGRLEPLFPSDSVTSTSPLRKALAVNPSMLKKFVEGEDGGQKTENGK